MNKIYYNAEGGEGGGGVSASVATATATTTGLTSTSAPSSLLTPGAGSAGTWFDQIKDEGLRGQAQLSFRDVKDIDSLVKTSLHAQKMVGTKNLEMPNEKWDDAKWSDFYKAAGRPDKPEGYKLVRPEAPKGMQFNLEEEKEAVTIFHQAGLNDSQVNKLLEWHYGKELAGHKMSEEKQVQTFKESETALRKEWGQDFDVNLNRAKQAVKTLGGEEVLQKLQSVGLDNDPGVLKMLAKAGGMMREDSATGLSVGGFSSSPERAEAEINALRGNAEFMAKYTNPNAVGHKEAREQMRNLYEVKTGGAKGTSFISSGR